MKQTHAHAKQLLLLALGELPSKEAARITEHLRDCESCSRNLEEQIDFLRRMEGYSRLMPSESFLRAARRRFLHAMNAPEKRTWKERLMEFGDRIGRPAPALRLATSAAILILGVIIGRVSLPGTGQTLNAVVALSSAPTVTNFQIETSIEKDHHVRIRFRAVQDFSLEGEVNHPDIQFALAYALVHDQRDNIRLKTVELLETSGYTENIQGALLHAAERDENPGVRLKAIRLLKNLPLNESIKQILISTLFQDPISGIQREAAEGLTRFEDQDILAILRKKAEDDEYMQFLIQKLHQKTPYATTNRNM